MKRTLEYIHLVAIGGLTALLLTSPLLALGAPKQEKKANPSSISSSTERLSPSAEDRSNNKPGPAWRIIDGTLKQMNNHVYTVEDYEGNQVELYISKDTKQLSGRKKVGDPVRAEITHSRFANSIQ